jgi:hypothetical protein
MKIRFGEFPEDHHFLLLTRPFVEWVFKCFGWLAITATVQFAQERTGSQVLLCVKWIFYFLLFGFVGAFVDWILSFKRYKSMAEKKSSPFPNVKISAVITKRRLENIKFKFRNVFVGGISLLLTIFLVGASNIATEKIIDALVEFHQAAK